MKNSIESVMPHAKEIVGKMTIEEKASLCSGKNFWNTKSIDRLGVESFMLTDGPHGLRKQDGDADHLGINESVKATCFPTAVSTACSFDRDLMFEMGKALGEECVAENVGIILGPAANIKRSPLCGRNFEYFSEDPLLTGEISSALINGIQSKNVGTSLKHYLANNQEKARLISNSVIDERALREIYLTGFEIAVKKAQPWTLMCSYNKINDIYASEHKRLMSDVPRGEWGFQGAIVTDWGAMNDRVEGIKAGLDLEMPAFDGTSDQMIVESVQAGQLDEKLVDICATRMTALALLASKKEHETYDAKEHNELARKIARESSVLLKRGEMLPVEKSAKVAIIGEFAKTPRYQGAGSSKIQPPHITSICEALDLEKINYTYAQGYESLKDETNDALMQEALEVAKRADTVIVVVGLPDSYESEGFDRAHLNMPEAHNQLVEALVETGKKVVAIVSTGSVVNLPWRDKVDSILLTNLAGQNGGYATFDLVFGDYSPCGKLAETYPLNLQDTPSIAHYGTSGNIEYRESIYVGYRYYDKYEKPVMYPFGYGLSYTTFQYSDLKLSRKKINDSQDLVVEVTITNTGDRDAKEIVQLYVAPPESTIFKAVRELRDFIKVDLKAKESKKVTFTLGSRAFAYYNVNINDWYVESGQYTIEIGASSRDIRQSETLEIASNQLGAIPNYQQSAPAYYTHEAKGIYDVPKEQFESVLGHKVSAERSIKPYTMNSTLGEVKGCFIGAQLEKGIRSSMLKTLGTGSEDLLLMIEAMLNDMSLRQLGMMSQGALNRKKTEGLIECMNGHYLKGIKKLMRK